MKYLKSATPLIVLAFVLSVSLRTQDTANHTLFTLRLYTPAKNARCLDAPPNKVREEPLKLGKETMQGMAAVHNENLGLVILNINEAHFSSIPTLPCNQSPVEIRI